MRSVRVRAGVLAGCAIVGLLGPALPTASAAVDVFAGACFVKLEVTHSVMVPTVDISTEPGSFCLTNDGTGSAHISGTVGRVGLYDCRGGVLSGPVDVSIDAAFDSFSATGVDLKLVNGNAAATLGLSFHTGSQHFVAAGELEEDNTPVEECLGGQLSVTMHGVLVFETPTDLSP